MRHLGIHLLAELIECNISFLDDTDKIKESMLEAAVAAKATALQSYFHKFVPQGVSGMVVIAESHLSIHTWPEFGYAAVDVFTCGDRTMPHKAIQHLVDALGAKHLEVTEVMRGYDYDAMEKGINNVSGG
jgi:S-adenosylmethionine decarboxylase